jgi:hypothetical protein
VKQFTVTIFEFFTLPLLPVKIINFPNKVNQCGRKAERGSGICKLDIHESMHRDTTIKITNKMHYTD